MHSIHKAQYIAECGGVVAFAVPEQLRRRSSGTVRAEHGGDSAAVDLLDAVADDTGKHDKRHALCLAALCHAGDDLALKALRIEPPLAGDDHVGAYEHIVKAHGIKYCVNARAQPAAQQPLLQCGRGVGRILVQLVQCRVSAAAGKVQRGASRDRRQICSEAAAPAAVHDELHYLAVVRRTSLRYFSIPLYTQTS